MSLVRDRACLAALLAYLLAISLPSFLAEAWAPPGSTFLGSLYNSQDTMVYLSAMRAGARGDWLRTLPYTTEPHPATLYYIFYTTIGHLAPPSLATFNSARLGMALLAAVALYALLGELIREGLERRIAFILALLGMGAGFAASVLGFGQAVRSTDIFLPSATLLGAGILNPHVPLGAGLEFAVFWAYLRARSMPYRNGTLLGGALMTLALGWTLPYQLVALGAVLSADALASVVMSRRVWTTEVRTVFWLMLPAASVALYYSALQTVMPFWSDLIAQWPRLEHQFALQDFVAGYGILWVTAFGGALWLARQPARSASERLLTLWLLVNAALIVSPLDFADRMSLGFGVPLACLTAIALARAVPRWLRRYRLGAQLAVRYPHFSAHAPWMMLIITLPSALLLGVTLALFASGNGGPPYYLAPDDVALFRWLARNGSTHDVAFAAPDIANLVPALSDARVYAGHTHETYQATRKLGEIRRFYDSATGDEWRREFLRAQGITLVFVQPYAHGAGGFSAQQSDYLAEVAAFGDSRLYRVSGLGPQ